jgi:hypothetical protein
MALFGFGELPEEIQQAIASQVERQHLAIVTSHHDIQRMLEELSLEHLLVFHGIFHHLASEGNHKSAYLEGLAVGVLRFKHNICGACGRNHDEDLQEQMEPSENKIKEALDRINETSDEDIQNALKWKVSFGTSGKVRCNNCGMEYQSLADRMLRSPDDCSGCHQKSAWG